ncbi:MAG: hypothetical protein AAB345_01685 [Patescibacteria group bacterium]
MKSFLKVTFVLIVIIFLVASYVMTGFRTPVRKSAANFQGPTGEPSVDGPTQLPPGK